MAGGLVSAAACALAGASGVVGEASAVLAVLAYTTCNV